MPLDEAYFVWLYSQVGSVSNKNRATSYWKLLKLLHQKEFTWSNIERDENRAVEGRNLRRKFLNETREIPAADDVDFLEFGCSVLEMMVALSWDLEFEGLGTQESCFWELIKNMGLTECTDANPPEPIIIDLVLDKIINRDYAPSGAGGLFPLQRNNDKTNDQRNVELWYQAQAYVLERI